MIVILPQKHAADICDAIRAKGYSVETMTAERAAINLDQFMEAPVIANMTKRAHKATTGIGVDDISPDLDFSKAPAHKATTGIGVDDISPDLTFKMEVN